MYIQLYMDNLFKKKPVLCNFTDLRDAVQQRPMLVSAILSFIHCDPV